MRYAHAGLAIGDFRSRCEPNPSSPSVSRRSSRLGMHRAGAHAMMSGLSLRPSSALAAGYPSRTASTLFPWQLCICEYFRPTASASPPALGGSPRADSLRVRVASSGRTVAVLWPAHRGCTLSLPWMADVNALLKHVLCIQYGREGAVSDPYVPFRSQEVGSSAVRKRFSGRERERDG